MNIVIKQIKLYEEPKFDEEGNFIKETLSEEEKEMKLQIDIKGEILDTNCGVPLVFVVNKSDVIGEEEETSKNQENREFILKHVRKLAVTYGATVIYTSSKTNCNLTVLYDYICHSLFQFDLLHKPNLSEKVAYFFPSGYDKMSSLARNDSQNYLNMVFEDIIKPAKANILEEEKEIVCEDTNEFLGKIKSKKAKSRKSVVKETIKNKAITSNYATEITPKMDIGNHNSTLDKVGKFQKFLDKRDSKIDRTNSEKVPEEKEGNSSFLGKEKETKEEKHKRTKEEMLKKLGLMKDNKKASLKLDPNNK